MSTAPTMFAGDGEPCTSCGSPLASDQRYCLTCGRRRADARLPFLEILRGEGPTEYRRLETVAGPAAAAPGPAWLAQARANTAIIAGVGVLLLAMLIGVLLGSGVGNDNTSNVADRRPVVVSVGGAAPVAAATTAPTDTTTSGAAASPAPRKKVSASKSASSSGASTIKPKAVAPAALQNLDKLSGKDYQKQVDKLGKNIATGGKAPPKDNKAPAGGGSFQDIG